MSSRAIALNAFIGIPGGVLLGFFLSTTRRPDHLRSDSKETVSLKACVVATTAALVLGLPDCVLAHYRQQANEVRNAAARAESCTQGPASMPPKPDSPIF